VEGVDLKGSAMTDRSPNAVRSLVALRRLARRLRGVGLSAAWLAGVGTAGAVVSMRKAYPRTPQAAPAQGWPPATPVPEGRLAVAVVLGASGSVITDALGPYEVFARSPRFFVYTVAAGRPIAMLSGGLGVVPDYSLEDVDTGSAPAPDLVVVPAVVAPNGDKEAPLREWITRQADRGAHLLGVCNGSRLLAATGLLDGRRATAHWSSIRGLERSRPQVDWVRGQRYIQDGTLTTTAGVTSGVVGALRLVEQLAGAAEAQRVGRELAYPGWSLRGPTEIRARRWTPGDLAYLLAVVFPWMRPTVGVGLVEGVGELEVAAPFEVYASSFAAGTVPIAAEATVTTRHGLRLVATPANAGAPRVDRLVVPGVGPIEEVDPQLLGWAADRGLNIELPNGGQAAGEFSFDAMLRDLAGHSDRVTARVTAESIEYPAEQLELAGAGWPGRPTALLALTVTAAIGVALVPAAAIRRNRR
jgi:putative intracellular protease/amidase